MGRELELKYRIDDPQAVRDRLAASEAQPTGRVLETNRIFDNAKRELLAADCGLRLRISQPIEQPVNRAAGCSVEQSAPGSTAGPLATLTYKGPREGGTLKSREELETTIGDPAACAALLNRLGFQEVIVYEKRRQSWRLDECEVALDELPRLGWFVEIEGPTPAAVRAVAARLALDSRSTLKETYVEMAARCGPRGAAGATRLAFDCCNSVRQKQRRT